MCCEFIRFVDLARKQRAKNKNSKIGNRFGPARQPNAHSSRTRQDPATELLWKQTRPIHKAANFLHKNCQKWSYNPTGPHYTSAFLAPHRWCKPTRVKAIVGEDTSARPGVKSSGASWRVPDGSHEQHTGAGAGQQRSDAQKLHTLVGRTDAA